MIVESDNTATNRVISTVGYDAINAYAQSHGYDLVLDSASNPTLLYNAPKLDQTEGVIKSLK